jgi:hypothetical protein
VVGPPQVFVDVANDSALAQTEQFCPIAPLIRAADEEDALRMANTTEFGLSSAVFTGDAARGLRLARRLEAGMTHINDSSPNDDPAAMFGGEKNSGIGRFNSDWIIEQFTTATGSACSTKRTPHRSDPGAGTPAGALRQALPNKGHTHEHAVSAHSRIHRAVQAQPRRSRCARPGD